MRKIFEKLKRTWAWCKRKWKQLLGALGIGAIGIALAVGVSSAQSDVSLERMRGKYEQAMELKAKYQLNGASLTREAKADPKDRIIVEIGDRNKSEFTPEIKLSRWDEVSFKVIPNLQGIAQKDKKLNFEGGKIKFETPKIEYLMYDTKNGYVQDVILKEKPATNKVEFAIETSGLDFFYQSPLTEKFQNGYSEEFQKEIVVSETQVKDLEGNVLVERPIEVVNSYAVYHQTKGGMNDINGKEYKTGKAFHIYRPHIIDAEGKETWGELDIDIEKGIMTKTTPQEFLDNAVFPVMMGTPGTTTGYFNAYDPGEAWNLNPANMVDGSLATYAYTLTDGLVQKLTSHTTAPLSNISAVKVRAYGYGDGNDWIYLRPIFSGGDGDNHQWIPSASAQWSDWFDITDDTNAPADWDSFFTSLDLDIEYTKSGKANAIRIYRVEVMEVYDNNTFGYTSAGGSSSIAETAYFGSVFTGAAGTGDSISAYCGGTSANSNYKMSVYLHSDSTKITNGDTNEGSLTISANWYTQTFVTSPDFSAVDYVLVYQNANNFPDNGFKYDAGDINQGHTQTNTYGTFPSTASFTHNNNKYSIYATYTTEGGEGEEEPIPDMSQIIGYALNRL